MAAETGCGKKFGDPESIQKLAQAFLETGSGLDQLIGELRRDIDAHVPLDWWGGVSKSFQERVGKQLTEAQQAGEKAKKLAEAAKTLATTLEELQASYQETRVQATLSQFDINDGCWVVGPGPGWPMTETVRELVQGEVDGETEGADTARRTFSASLADSWLTAQWIKFPDRLGFAMALLGMMYSGGKTGKKGTGQRVPRTQRWGGKKIVRGKGPISLTAGTKRRLGPGDVKPNTPSGREDFARQLGDPNKDPNKWPVDKRQNVPAAFYDEKGNVYLERWKWNSQTLKWESVESVYVGKIDMPNLPYGSTALGREMEPRVNDLLKEHTDLWLFDEKNPSHTGPDIPPMPR